ncbi:sialic acid-binding Ig-like lectin 13 [Hypanus sabinus]|uniref:sialic acid-binding Ig-like lectin 13 n=1 Tax=Hypanus sabinus TaxID=79690 RepID=UPI0028C428D9|nr:sialic acid-binding Ig-like lectin 13 [Hypanus sabinus]
MHLTPSSAPREIPIKFQKDQWADCSEIDYTAPSTEGTGPSEDLLVGFAKLAIPTAGRKTVKGSDRADHLHRFRGYVHARLFLERKHLLRTVPNEWGAETPSDVTAQRGLCARIPCHYRYPSRLDENSRTGIWYNSKKQENNRIAFHSSDHSQEMQKFQHRTRLSGDLNDDDCSLVIDNITQEDEGPYYFRIEFAGSDRYNYQPVTWLRVSNFTDKPMIFAGDIVEGKSVKITCIFNTTCNGTSPTLTWVTPTDVPPSVSSSVTRWHNTLTYTSVLTMTPALKHHGQSLTCRVRYPSVSSEQNLTLTVQHAPQNFSITSPNNVNSSWMIMKEGIPTSILCSVQSFPVSNLTWKHLGVTLSTTSSSNKLWLVFPQVTPQQAGDYECVAENEHGTAERVITLSVEYQTHPENSPGTSPSPTSAGTRRTVVSRCGRWQTGNW